VIIHIINRQKICRINAAGLKALTDFFLGKSLPAATPGFREISVLLTDDAGIREVNRQFFDRDHATDVISFILKPRPGERKFAGEIVINIGRVIEEGRKHGGMEHEFALYLAHGCDHLAGNDDRTVKERGKMRRRELKWLKEAAAKKFLRHLFF
jgi:rRNA maturation RNase YbeY